MTLAFSYIRFSSAKQELGDSVRRQEKRAVDYATKHGLTLDTHSYRDLGVSAFKGKNVTEGRLGSFLNAIEKKIIPQGSYLLVENLDRLSRNEVDVALEQLLSIIRHGITVVTLDDEKVYSSEKIRQDKGISLIISIASMSRANEESAVKADRVHQAWEGKRVRGEILTSIAPAWLKLSEDRKSWKILENKANLVRQIFQLAIAGNGTPTIAKKLNELKQPTMKTAEFWTFGTVNAILKNPAVIGLYTPKKAIGASSIPNYYPQIISETDFKLAKEGMENRRWIGGRNSHAVRNLFAGLCICYKCRSPMRIVSAGGKHTYIRCSAAYYAHGCDEVRMPYLACELTILKYLSEDLSEFMVRTPITEDDPAVTLNEQKVSVNKRLQKLLDLAEEVENSVGLAQRINSAEREIRELDKKLQIAKNPADREVDKFLWMQLWDKLEGWDGPITDVEERLQIQQRVRLMIDEIEFDSGIDTNDPAVCVRMSEEFGGDSKMRSIHRYMEKVGGNRRKKKVAKLEETT
ncbi:MAG: recombinase family protein [Burkholderiales bacterium]|nr:recombinase family protein [Burkholderiales bacterium]